MTGNGVWVFGYGSLIWDPGFSYLEQQIARLDGFHRGFCMRSIHYRGTPERPGLVLALDRARGAFCEGVAFRVTPERATEVLQGLRERELISSAYLEAELPVCLRDGREVRSVAYIIDRNHAQYCGRLPLEDQAQIIATATGHRGPNAKYLHNTFSHLTELGLQDEDLAWLAERVRVLTALNAGKGVGER